MKFCWIKVAVFPGLKNVVHVGVISGIKKKQKIDYIYDSMCLKHMKMHVRPANVAVKEAGDLNLSIFSIKT